MLYKTLINFQKKPSSYIMNFVFYSTCYVQERAHFALAFVVVIISAFLYSPQFVFNESIYFSSQESTENVEETLQTLLFSSYLFLSFERHYIFQTSFLPLNTKSPSIASNFFCFMLSLIFREILYTLYIQNKTHLSFVSVPHQDSDCINNHF